MALPNAPKPGAEREKAACTSCVFHTDSFPFVFSGRTCGELEPSGPSLGRRISILLMETELGKLT